MEKDITKKIKPFIIYSVPIILLIAVVAIFGVYKWNQGQGIININDAKLTSSKVMVVAQNDGTLTELLVNDGDKVEAGQVIAKIGSTGWSTGNHCHFEVRVNGSHTNPWPYLND